MANLILWIKYQQSGLEIKKLIKHNGRRDYEFLHDLDVARLIVVQAGSSWQL
jgi:hypothetical protein